MEICIKFPEIPDFKNRYFFSFVSSQESGIVIQKPPAWTIPRDARENNTLRNKNVDYVRIMFNRPATRTKAVVLIALLC